MIILVGLKIGKGLIWPLLIPIDLRDDPKTVSDLMDRCGRGPITKEEGIEASRRMGCDYYIECSSCKGEGVKEVFDTAIRMSVNPAYRRVGIPPSLPDKPIEPKIKLAGLLQLAFLSN